MFEFSCWLVFRWNVWKKHLSSNIPSRKFEKLMVSNKKRSIFVEKSVLLLLSMKNRSKILVQKVLSSERKHYLAFLPRFFRKFHRFSPVHFQFLKLSDSLPVPTLRQISLSFVYFESRFHRLAKWKFSQMCSQNISFLESR